MLLGKIKTEFDEDVLHCIPLFKCGSPSQVSLGALVRQVITLIEHSYGTVGRNERAWVR